jgi:chemotaxis protein methyltransferase CheR
MIQWRKFNLLDSFGALGQFDIVFCRNVLIYFDQPTKADVLQRICKVLTPDGYMVLGAAETVVGLTEAFRPLSDRRGVYVPATASAQAGASQPFARLAAVGGGAA